MTLYMAREFDGDGEANLKLCKTVEEALNVCVDEYKKLNEKNKIKNYYINKGIYCLEVVIEYELYGYILKNKDYSIEEFEIDITNS